MICSYPIILTPDDTGYCVYLPDFDANTQGDSLAQAIEMARDAMGIMGITWEDAGRQLPQPGDIRTIKAGPDDIITLVNVDFTDYRRKNDMRAVKKNCTIPGWLNYAAEKANINFSQVLQAALKQKLHLLEHD